MKGFKDSTRTVSGHHHWGGGSVGGTGGTINRLSSGGPVSVGRRDGLAQGGSADRINSNPGHPEVYPSNGDRMHGNSATQRSNPPTRELEEHGGRTPLISKFKKGGHSAKHFHVHKHFHAKGGRTHTVSHSYGATEKHAETYAEGGHVHDSTHIPAGYPDYAKGGKAKHWIKGAIKHPGAFRAKAKRAGMSTAAYAARVTKPGSGASTQTKRQGNLAKTLGKVRKNAGGALYATGGPTKLALGGMPMGGALTALGAPGRLAMRPTGVPARPALPMRRAIVMPGPSLGEAPLGGRMMTAPARPLVADPGSVVQAPTAPVYRGPLNAGSMMARGGPVSMRKVAKQEVAKHVRTAPPRGHGVK